MVKLNSLITYNTIKIYNDLIMFTKLFNLVFQ